MDSLGSSVFVINSPVPSSAIVQVMDKIPQGKAYEESYHSQAGDCLSPGSERRRSSSNLHKPARTMSVDQGKVAQLAQKFSFGDPSAQRKVEDWFSRTDDGSVRSGRTNSRPPSPVIPREYRRSMSAFGYNQIGMGCSKSVSTPALNSMEEQSMNRGRPSLSDPLSPEAAGFSSRMHSSLSPMDECQIKLLVGDPRLTLQIVYQASVHGYDPKIFHTKCDLIGPTLVLVTTKSGARFGVYTSVGWCSRGGGVNDKKAFLFRVNQGFSGEDGAEKILKATQNEADLHIHDDPDLGPFFGSLEKPSLRLFCNVFQANSAKVYEDGPFTGGTLLDIVGVEEGPLDLEDVEVYNATTRVSPLLERPWRDVEFNTETLISLILFLTSYKPSFCGLEQINILMLGATGCGKSSIFNTLESTFKQHIAYRARTGSTTQGVTKQFRRYMIQHLRGQLPLQICDAPGVSEALFTASDLVYILDGHLSDRFGFPVSGKITNRSQGFTSETTLREEMHCVVFVIDATNIPQPGSHLFNKILEMKTEITARDIPIRVFLTKVDLVCSITAANLKFVYKSVNVTEKIEKVCELFSIDRKEVFPMKCYEQEIKLVESVGLLALSALQNAIYAAESYLEDRESIHGPTVYLRKGRSASNVSGGSGPTSYNRTRSIDEGRERSLSDLLYGGSPTPRSLLSPTSTKSPSPPTGDPTKPGDD